MNNPEEFSSPAHSLSRRRMFRSGAAASASLATIDTLRGWAAVEDGIGHSAESIHQEPVFQVDRKRIYEALTDARQFDEIVRLSAAMRSGAIGSKPAEISREVGGAFTIFGGYIIGRQLDLLPGERIVQAWRPQSWSPGDYSIAKFVLVDEGSKTRIVLDHKGFPDGLAPHLAAGWKGNYWDPLEKYFAQK